MRKKNRTGLFGPLNLYERGVSRELTLPTGTRLLNGVQNRRVLLAGGLLINRKESAASSVIQVLGFMKTVPGMFGIICGDFHILIITVRTLLPAKQRK